MAIYTFDCRRADGAPVCLEARDLATDAAAMEWAPRVLATHGTCDYVEVFFEERLVGVARKP